MTGPTGAMCQLSDPQETCKRHAKDKLVWLSSQVAEQSFDVNCPFETFESQVLYNLSLSVGTIQQDSKVLNKINRMNGSWDGHGLITQYLLCFLWLREALIRSQPSSGVHEAVWGIPRATRQKHL